MKKIKKQYAALLIVAIIISFQLIRSSIIEFNTIRKKQSEISSIPNFHTPKEMKVFHDIDERGGPIGPGEYFLISTNCQGCHGRDSAEYANIDADSVDVNLFDDWRATMMANSARDPLWRAKVSHEILVDPGNANALQNKCTSCHAPMGHYTSMYKGYPFYTIADLINDTLGLDGVSCTGCHMIGPDQLGALFSGDIPYDTNHVAYGPFTAPVTGPMQLYVGLTPIWSDHVSQGKMCSSCHTLLLNSVDLVGVPTGRTFIEQATYHEWVNSTYSSDAVVCQSCHMPKANDSIIIANGYLNLPPRFPFNQHKFQGGNLFMLNLMKDNKTTLGIVANDANYDSSISATVDILKNNTLSVDLSVDSVNVDTAYFTVKLTNHAGHKFPSGYPSRRAVLQFVVIGSANDTLFKSGFFDPNYEVVNIDPNFEPHYNIISNQLQAQIYEMVPGDVNGNFTSVLERSDTMLKDNRIPPEGFLSTAFVYDTVKIVGDAWTDPDFNKALVTSVEGTGKDYVHYHIYINGYTQPFSIYTYVYFQSIAPGFLNEMFSYNSADIDTFRNMYMAADKSPFLIGSDSINNIALGTKIPDWDELIKVGPSPTSDGYVNIYLPEASADFKVNIYENLGKLVKELSFKDLQTTYSIQLPYAKGTYIIEIIYKGKHYIRKTIRN